MSAPSDIGHPDLKRDREAALSITGPCSCHEAYRGRGLVAPDCVFHDCADEISAALSTARAEGRTAGFAEGDAAGYARGIEDAAVICEADAEQFIRTGYPVQQQLVKRAAAIRALAEKERT